jgi:ribonucleoside-diphosphate reductase alpha chain
MFGSIVDSFLNEETHKFVKKRNGKLERVNYNKIYERIRKLGNENLGEHGILTGLNYQELSMFIIKQLGDFQTTTEIDLFSAEKCQDYSTYDVKFSALASRIYVSNMHKNTNPSFYQSMKLLYENKADITRDDFIVKEGVHIPLISKEVFDIIENNKEEFESRIVNERDYLFDYFGLKTLENAYLIKANKIEYVNGKKINSSVLVERPQYMFMRVAVGIHGDDLKSVFETYDLMSQKYFIHATPTLLNAGTIRPQMSSCFLMQLKDDSISKIFETLKDCAEISKYAGGIGIHIHNLRAKGSYIAGTNGRSNGLVPMLRVFDATAHYVDQGGGKRPGSFAIYLEPWHSDIEEFIDLKLNTGNEFERAKDLFYGLWIPDLFMERVKNNEKWTLFCPNECKGLADCYGDEFKELYEKYEKSGYGYKTVNAVDLFRKILFSQIQTGTPYMCYKDSANKKSNQQNIGVIKSSNLCTEIMEVSNPEETAVCNLASIGLPTFVSTNSNNEPFFDFDKLHSIAKVITRNLNRVIDRNYYPTKEAKYSNMKNRPIGIGVQGLADTFMLMGYCYGDEQSRLLNKNIFETIYHGALEASNELALDNVPYETFEGSPASRGILQFDMWDGHDQTNDRYDWDLLKRKITNGGLRNSLLLAPMPTASTSQILGFTECFEPITSNLYTRNTKAGNYKIINKYLMNDLKKQQLWNGTIRNKIIENNGGIQNIYEIPEDIRNKYKTAYDISAKVILDMSADRGVYICQSQSLNIYMDKNKFDTDEKFVSALSNMHMYGWKKGLKTGMYYFRHRTVAKSDKFTLETNAKKYQQQQQNEEKECVSCSA